MQKKSSEEPIPEKDCFLCGAGDTFINGFSGIKAAGRSFDIRFCKSCGLGVTVPFLSDEELKGLYSSIHYRAEDATRFISPLEKLVKRVRLGRCRNVERFSVKKGRILDIGCGRGDFLALMAERGWTGTGLEVDERVEGLAARSGLDLRAGQLGDVSLEESEFDALTFWHVFEHIKRPRAALAEARRVLKPGGLLVVAVPNIESLQARLTGRHWFHIDPPYHMYHYSTENLERLIEDSGFDVLDVRHFSFEYNPFGYLQSILNALGFRQNLLYDFLQTKSLPANGGGAYLSLAIMFALMPFLLPVSLIMSVAESVVKRGGTIEVYARNRR